MSQINTIVTAKTLKYQARTRFFWCMIVWLRYDLFLQSLCQAWADGAWQGLEEGLAGWAPSHPLLGSACVATGLQHSASRNNLLGDKVLTPPNSLAKLPVNPTETRFLPSFYYFNILYIPATRSSWSSLQKVCCFVLVFFPDFGNKAVVNVTDPNRGSKLFLKVESFYRIEKCNAKFSKSLLNAISTLEAGA